MGYTAYNLTDEAKTALLQRFPPRYERVACHHVTVAPNVEQDHELPAPAALRVVGYVDDGAGIEAVVVTVDGNLTRADGGTFHITHSLSEGRSKVESNHVIEKLGWNPVAEPFDIDGVPQWND